MSTLSTIRLGELAYHALDFQSQTQEKWVDFFQDKEEAEAMLIHEDCSIYTKIQDPAVAKEAERAVNIALKRFRDGVVEAGVGHSVQVTCENPTGSTFTSSVSAAPTVLVFSTDKGSFFHLDSWKKKLLEIYKYLDGFDKIFADACLEVGVDPTLDFISESKKKSVTGKLKKCTLAYLEKLEEGV